MQCCTDEPIYLSKNGPFWNREYQFECGGTTIIANSLDALACAVVDEGFYVCIEDDLLPGEGKPLRTGELVSFINTVSDYKFSLDGF
jgi:hypothetical protein